MRSEAERVFGRFWVISLLVLMPVITICVSVVVIVALMTVVTLAVLLRVAPQQLRRRIEGLSLG